MLRISRVRTKTKRNVHLQFSAVPTKVGDGTATAAVAVVLLADDTVDDAVDDAVDVEDGNTVRVVVPVGRVGDDGLGNGTCDVEDTGAAATTGAFETMDVITTVLVTRMTEVEATDTIEVEITCDIFVV